LAQHRKKKKKRHERSGIACLLGGGVFMFNALVTSAKSSGAGDTRGKIVPCKTKRGPLNTRSEKAKKLSSRKSE